MLEQQLEQIDNEEQALLNLGCNREDSNAERHAVLGSLDVALKDYGKAIEISGTFRISCCL